MKRLIFCVLVFQIQFFSFGHAISKDTILTIEEQRWLAKNKDKIRYAPNPSWPPGDYIEDGIHKGFVADYINIFEKRLNLSFQRIFFENWTDILEGLRQGEADFVGAIHQTQKRDEYLIFTDHYLEIPLVVLISNKYAEHFRRDRINDMKLACVKKYSSIEYINQAFPGAEIVECSDDLSALLKTSLGKTDGTVIDPMIASYLVEKYGITNMELAMELDFKWQLRFGVRKELPELCSILNKFLNAINEQERESIYRKWVNIEVAEPIGFWDKHMNTILFIIVILFMVAISMLIIRMLIKNQVVSKTRELKLAKMKAEESELKYKQIADNITDVVWKTDFTLNTTYISPSIYKLTGISPEEYNNMNIERKHPPETIMRFKEIFEKELENEKDPEVDRERTMIIEGEHYMVDGSRIQISMHVIFVRDEDGNPVGLQGVTRDVTEKHKMLQALEARMEELERFHKVTVGREIMMIELKKEVNELLRKYGEKKKYKITEVT